MAKHKTQNHTQSLAQHRRSVGEYQHTAPITSFFATRQSSHQNHSYLNCAFALLILGAYTTRVAANLNNHATPSLCPATPDPFLLRAICHAANAPASTTMQMYRPSTNTLGIPPNSAWVDSVFARTSFEGEFSPTEKRDMATWCAMIAYGKGNTVQEKREHNALFQSPHFKIIVVKSSSEISEAAASYDYKTHSVTVSAPANVDDVHALKVYLRHELRHACTTSQNLNYQHEGPKKPPSSRAQLAPDRMPPFELFPVTAPFDTRAEYEALRFAFTQDVERLKSIIASGIIPEDFLNVTEKYFKVTSEPFAFSNRSLATRYPTLRSSLDTGEIYLNIVETPDTGIIPNYPRYFTHYRNDTNGHQIIAYYQNIPPNQLDDRDHQEILDAHPNGQRLHDKYSRSKFTAFFRDFQAYYTAYQERHGNNGEDFSLKNFLLEMQTVILTYHRGIRETIFPNVVDYSRKRSEAAEKRCNEIPQCQRLFRP